MLELHWDVNYIERSNLYVISGFICFRWKMVVQVMLLKAPCDDGTNDGYQEYLDSLGFDVSLVPVIEFCFINSDSLLTELEDPEKYCGIIFTSKRSVKAVEIATSK